MLERFAKCPPLRPHNSPCQFEERQRIRLSGSFQHQPALQNRHRWRAAMSFGPPLPDTWKKGHGTLVETSSKHLRKLRKFLKLYLKTSKYQKYQKSTLRNTDFTEKQPTPGTDTSRRIGP